MWRRFQNRGRNAFWGGGGGHLCVEGVDDHDAKISVQARNVTAADGVANLQSRKIMGGFVNFQSTAEGREKEAAKEQKKSSGSVKTQLRSYALDKPSS